MLADKEISLELTANSSSFYSIQFYPEYLSNIQDYDQNYNFFSSSVILEAVVSSAAILSLIKTSRAQKGQFDWPMQLNVTTQVAGKVLHRAKWGKFPATLRDALRKVELTSAFHNACGHKKNCEKCV